MPIYFRLGMDEKITGEWSRYEHHLLRWNHASPRESALVSPLDLYRGHEDVDSRALDDTGEQRDVYYVVTVHIVNKQTA